MELRQNIFLYQYAHMMKQLEGSKRSGRFVNPPPEEISGELKCAGPNTCLHLHGDEFINPQSLIRDRYISGILDDLTRVSLLGCISAGPGSVSRGSEKYHFADFFPHYIIFGDDHLKPADEAITSAWFVVDDAHSLFYDFDAFGLLTDARPFIDRIVQAHIDEIRRVAGNSREIPTGAHPSIQYFTGKSEIFSADTTLGRVTASHNPRSSMGGPTGVSLQNTIRVGIEFGCRLTFTETIERVSILLPYLGLMAGRPQKLLELHLRADLEASRNRIYEVYWSLAPTRADASRDWEPQPSDMLANGGMEPEVFSRVLTGWLDRQLAWRDARERFFQSFAKQDRYDVDRLIGASNMFDILPTSSLPPNIQLSEEMQTATEECRRIFRRLPVSPERDSVLNALGRVGTHSLKRKIRYRTDQICRATGERFSDLSLITDQAVNCRNHYVHGSATSVRLQFEL